MRATAKWILAAAAAVGAALLGGGPLTAVGKVHGVGGAALAYLGLAVGLCGVGWAIWYTAEALIPPLTTPLSLDTEPSLKDLRARIAREPNAFYGPFGTSMADLHRELAFHQSIARKLGDALAAEPDQARQRVMSEQLEQARTAVTAARRRSLTLLELTHAWQVRAQLRRARLHALAGAALAAVGAVLFLAATSTTTTSTPGPVLSPAASASANR